MRLLSTFMGTSQDERHVRIATPREFVEVAWVLARAFAHDPCLNWFGHVKQMLPTEIDNYNALPPNAKSTLKKLYAFQYALVRATALSGGIVTVAVVPSTEQEQTRDGAPKKEVIAGATLWLKPGQTLDFTLGTVIRSGLFKVPFAWGLTGAKVSRPPCEREIWSLRSICYVATSSRVLACSRT